MWTRSSAAPRCSPAGAVLSLSCMRTRQEGSAQDADSMKLFGSDANIVHCVAAVHLLKENVRTRQRQCVGKTLRAPNPLYARAEPDEYGPAAVSPQPAQAAGAQGGNLGAFAPPAPPATSLPYVLGVSDFVTASGAPPGLRSGIRGFCAADAARGPGAVRLGVRGGACEFVPQAVHKGSCFSLVIRSALWPSPSWKCETRHLEQRLRAACVGGRKSLPAFHFGYLHLVRLSTFGAAQRMSR